MILGERFAWAHMGKTAGDATAALFAVVGDLVVFQHDTTDRRKHQTFKSFGEAALAKELKVLNLRRLPAWQVSVAQHRARHGTAEDPTPIPVPPAPELSRSTEGDDMLQMYTDNGRIPVARWLRVETLRMDFADFVSELRPLTDQEMNQILHVETKPAAHYTHDVRHWFDDSDLRRLYDLNPMWRDVEERLYGSLLVD